MTVSALPTLMRTRSRGRSEGSPEAVAADLAQRLEAARSASARVKRLEGERVGDRLIEVTAALAAVLPDSGLRPGASYAVEGSTALAAALIAKPSTDGAWCGVVGMPGFAAEGAAGLGTDLDRVVFVPRPGRDWVNVVVALVDALSIVVVRPPSQISDGEAARLSARLRQREAVLIACGSWPRPAATISVSSSRWDGLGSGYGHLTSRRVEVTSVGRGSAVRPKRTTLWLPDAEGNVRLVDPTEYIVADFTDERHEASA